MNKVARIAADIVMWSAIVLYVIALITSMAHGQVQGRHMNRVTMESSPLEQARLFKVYDWQHVKYAYRVGLMSGIDTMTFHGDVVTTVQFLDPLTPLVDQPSEVTLCGDQTRKLADLYHKYFTIVYTKTSPHVSYDCRQVVALYEIKPPETAPELQ